MTNSDHLARRRFLTGVGVGSALLGVAALTHSALQPGPYSLAHPRSRLDSPQDVPVNRSARQAGVVDMATDSRWRLRVRNDADFEELTLTDLDAMPQRREVLPIACVEGWTVSASWEGVRLRDLLDRVNVPADATVRLRSMQQRGAFSTTLMEPQYARHPKTLLALRLNGEQLDLDHGYPARIIAPGRPGVLQTKWLQSIEAI
ncbi:molybdopterin-dependent oxidoreductase [Leucobacter viscericola]|uniref:Molybdopterin-dependent oxidoreductase n=1 Tax=Leucobacter viscericola TaxID=2714935 RepID=A0A6G7XFJ5_9MICO|nr:molybdopterin-dependent oxidoreductase [Leucobacter viscericola]QIK63167.1 molybdopterin-dependent oxidoreductase [Leucobacter viscericola]